MGNSIKYNSEPSPSPCIWGGYGVTFISYATVRTWVAYLKRGMSYIQNYEIWKTHFSVNPENVNSVRNLILSDRRVGLKRVDDFMRTRPSHCCCWFELERHFYKINQKRAQVETWWIFCVRFKSEPKTGCYISVIQRQDTMHNGLKVV